MERELWTVLYRVVREVARGFCQKYVHIPGWILILTMLWAALHERPVQWACRPENWKGTRQRPPRLPSAQNHEPTRRWRNAGILVACD